MRLILNEVKKKKVRLNKLTLAWKSYDHNQVKAALNKQTSAAAQNK